MTTTLNWINQSINLFFFGVFFGRLITTCWQSVCICKWDGSFFAHLHQSENNCNQLKLDHDCLETVCLPLWDLCDCLVNKNGCPDCDTLSVYEWTLGCCSWPPNVEINCKYHNHSSKDVEVCFLTYKNEDTYSILWFYFNFVSKRQLQWVS